MRIAAGPTPINSHTGYPRNGFSNVLGPSMVLYNATPSPWQKLPAHLSRRLGAALIMSSTRRRSYNQVSTRTLQQPPLPQKDNLPLRPH